MNTNDSAKAFDALMQETPYSHFDSGCEGITPECRTCRFHRYLLASREVENIFENSDFVYLLNQASGDRQILSKALNISPSQQNYITNSNAGEGLIFYGSTIVPFKDDFPKDTQLYRIMTTRLEETVQN